ncbi:MAG: PP2C family protein-serine/threonine phosphatase [Alphaproteobacteria bacterium]
MDSTVVFSRDSGEVSGVRDEMGHYLISVQGDAPGKRIEISDSAVGFGRDQAGDVVISDTAVSRRHMQCSVLNNELIVSDLGSTNGTFLDGERLAAPAIVPDGSIIQLGQQIYKYELRSKQDVAKSEELDRDLDKASNYVLSLLPDPIRRGAVQTDWFYLPSAALGGDAFGYYELDDEHFVAYVVDVSGHGVGAAMHSVTVLNVLRQRALPNTDFLNPAAVLESLNEMFQMDTHDGQYFTIWYGVYNKRTRLMRYATAGHHAGYLVPADRASHIPLQTKSLMIGAMPGYSYKCDEATMPAGSTLYLFSDGVFEILTHDGKQWTLDDFLPLLSDPMDPQDEPQRLFQAVRNISQPGPFDDDFSLLVVTFE